MTHEDAQRKSRELWNQALDAEERGDYRKAKELYQTILATLPKDVWYQGIEGRLKFVKDVLGEKHALGMTALARPQCPTEPETDPEFFGACSRLAATRSGGRRSPVQTGPCAPHHPAARFKAAEPRGPWRRGAGARDGRTSSSRRRPARAPACGGHDGPARALARQKARRSLRPRRASAASGSPAVRGAPRLRRFQPKP